MRTLKKSASGMAGAAVAVGVVVGIPATASAEPATGSVGYEALFDAGAQVYEVSAVENWAVSIGGAHRMSDVWLQLDRVPDARAGQPSTVKYVIWGEALPDTFYLDGKAGDTSVRTNPGPGRTPQMTRMDSTGTEVTSVGPFAIPGVPGPIAVAFAYDRS
ncbi:hypothetical protein [Rhodococcus xishaensis]|uniref:Uncharacterized protein n=1 Tax=Rhodococcus xishaensis TaxID=2487364 RepID=A0A3S3B7T3_9NOCA|nr:hypothetical protein [Rhodococcus xishaensis]RVW05159.1 hypothetical protein EGT50_00520 [Rhodococcus xishaensis]